MISKTPDAPGSAMDSQRWQRLKSILADALEQESPAARTAFIERSCADDANLLREAESLLAEAESLLRDANDQLEDCADHAETRIPRDNVSEIGKRVGAYVITREIGQGGMGTVYQASRADGHFEKQVAIKLLTRGTNTEEVLRRFRSEREVLARLDHPNIARLLDAGTTDDGLPYFVMEYVDGAPVVRFLEEDNAPISARLTLFLKICGAVEVAHRNSIVHRDLKAGNILVTKEGEPKLLDFGIAKLIGNDMNPLERTALGQQRLTPISASPEQAQGETVTKSSDVYALGALLYEMLTGVRPHRFFTRNPSRQELVSVVCEQEPVPPSLATKDRRIARTLRGDLDAIVLYALQKDPSRRYPSAAEFAEDIRHYLEGKPITARSGGAGGILRATMLSAKSRCFALAASVIGLVALGIVLWATWIRAPSKSLTISTPSTSKPVTAEKSIAVLPFDNFGGTEESSYFVDGVQDNILTDLAKVSDLKVISRTSVASYRGGGKKNAGEIGRALGVSHVLEGSVQRSGDRIRVNAQLIDTRTEAGVWAERYDRKIEDLFLLQSELAQTIVTQLKATLSPTEKAAIEKRPTNDMPAYDLYLRAREAFVHYDNPKSVELLEAAVARDPQFVLAYCLLAEVRLRLYRYMPEMAPEHLTAAKQAADTASRLAPDSAETHLAQAQYYYLGLRDFEQTLRELAKTTAPSDKATFIDLRALAERRLGKWKEAIRDAETAHDLDPKNPFIVTELLESYLAVRRYDDAITLADKAIAMVTPKGSNAFWLSKADSLIAMGRLEEARTTLSEAPLNDEMRAFKLSENALFARDYQQAWQHVAGVPRRDGESYWPFLTEAMIARAQGDQERARSSYQAARDRLELKLAAGDKEPSMLSAVSFADAGLGRNDDARRRAEEVVRLVPTSKDAIDGPMYMTMLAQIYGLTGETDKAIETLAGLVSRPRGPSYGQLQFDPMWDPIRSDPRFPELTRKAREPIVLE
jgi:serine/threonine protein kinase/tetratricopeptide (TPR) repeat protein